MVQLMLMACKLVYYSYTPINFAFLSYEQKKIISMDSKCLEKIRDMNFIVII